MKHKIVADSSCNFFQLPDVDFSSVPLKVLSGNREYVDNAHLDVGEMVATLKAEKAAASTSCPNMLEWSEAFGDADQVFAISLTSKLSGSYNAALQAAGEFKRENPERRIMVLDTLSAGPELQLIAEKLRECILSGDTFEQIRKTVREYSKHTHLLFSLESLTNLARNGRVSPAVAKIAGVLGLRLVGKASDHGTLEPLHKVRGEKKALKTIYEEMRAAGYRGGKVAISHCQNEPAARELAAIIRQDFPDAPVDILHCAALCSFYAEAGGMLVGYEDL